MVDQPFGAVVVGVVPGIADAVLEEAARIAGDLDCRVVCVHVDASRYTVEGPDGTMTTLPYDPDLPEFGDSEPDPRLVEQLARVLDARGASWTLREVAGEPAHVLGRVADAAGARLIVVGAREAGLRSGLREFFTGSVAAHLTHRQHRPVLVVPVDPVTDGGPLPWE